MSQLTLIMFQKLSILEIIWEHKDLLENSLSLKWESVISKTITGLQAGAALQLSLP